MTAHELIMQLQTLPPEMVVVGGLDGEIMERTIHFVDRDNPNFAVIVFGSHTVEHIIPERK
jgi:hypothetical protein